MSKGLVAIALIVMLGSAHAHLGCKVSCECGYGHQHHQPSVTNDSACGSKTELNDYLIQHELLNPIFCHICEKLIEHLPAVINEHTVQKAFDHLCGALSFPVKYLCKKVAHKFSKKIAELINSGVAKAQICHKIRLC